MAIRDKKYVIYETPGPGGSALVMARDKNEALQKYVHALIMDYPDIQKEDIEASDIRVDQVSDSEWKTLKKSSTFVGGTKYSDRWYIG